ncbi:MAG: maltose phosphorylase, partial [Myxococcales bacterium]|nr:maltose phosphorylase [Myxococcales bacterium]
RNTHEGLHTTALAAAWMNIIYGYGGLRSDGDQLLLNPVLPREWKSLEFGLCVRNSVVRVKLTPEGTSIKTVSGPALKVNVWGVNHEIGKEGLHLPAKVTSTPANESTSTPARESTSAPAREPASESARERATERAS